MVKARRKQGLSFIVDKLTNSIENVVTGDSFPTDISIISHLDFKTITKRSGWQFDWNNEYNHPERDIYKLTISNQSAIQGLISTEVLIDHVFVHLIESAPFNKGRGKFYSGVPGNLIAFACKLSFQRGHDGNVSFISKTQLLHHYEESLGAIHIGGRRMIINTEAAMNLINKYFQNKTL